MNSSETYDEKENTSCSCVTFDNKGCIFENICPDYIGKPSTFNRVRNYPLTYFDKTTIIFDKVYMLQVGRYRSLWLVPNL